MKTVALLIRPWTRLDRIVNLLAPFSKTASRLQLILVGEADGGGVWRDETITTQLQCYGVECYSDASVPGATGQFKWSEKKTIAHIIAAADLVLTL